MILKLLRLILEILRVIVNRGAPPKPGPLRLNSIRQEGSMYIYTLTLPEETASDVVTHEVTLSIGSNPPLVLTNGPDDTETAEFAVDQATLSEFTTSYVQIDRNGNRSSPPVEQTWAVEDKDAPPRPGELGLNFKRSEP